MKIDIVPLLKDFGDVVRGKIDKCMYTVDITAIVWITGKPLATIFSNVPMRVECTASSDIAEGFSIRWENDLYDPYGSKTVKRMTFYKNVPIWLTTSTKTDESIRGNKIKRPEIELRVLYNKKNIAVLHEFIEKICRKGINLPRTEYHDYVHCYDKGNNSLHHICRSLRTFDNVFVTKAIHESITNSLDKFVSNRDWYIKNGIPYHFGILLYGSPGTGKSALAQAIADYIGAEMSVISGDDIADLPGIIGNMIPRDTVTKKEYRVILLEDIDCGFCAPIDKEKPITDEEKETRKKGLASILNAIDGVAAPSNTVFVFTTNHIEKLDPALIRPGRCDLSLEIGCVNTETFNEFCEHHYNKHTDNISIKEGLTFAILQTEVMKGKTFEEICDFVRKEES